MIGLQFRASLSYSLISHHTSQHLFGVVTLRTHCFVSPEGEGLFSAQTHGDLRLGLNVAMLAQEWSFQLRRLLHQQDRHLATPSLPCWHPILAFHQGGFCYRRPLDVRWYSGQVVLRDVLGTEEVWLCQCIQAERCRRFF
eukprot:EG_transcript_28687